MNHRVAVNETHKTFQIEEILLSLKERPILDIDMTRIEEYIQSLEKAGLLQVLKHHYFYDVKRYDYFIVIMKHKPNGGIFKLKVVMPHHIASLVYQFRVVEYLALKHKSEWK